MVGIILGKQQKIILPKTIKLLEILFFLWILSRPVGPSSEENDNSALLSKVTLLTPFSGWIGYIWRIVPLRYHSHVVIIDGQLLFSCREGGPCQCYKSAPSPAAVPIAFGRQPILCLIYRVLETYESLYIAFGYLATYGLPWFIVYSYLHLGNLHQCRPVLISVNYFRKKIPETPSTCI